MRKISAIFILLISLLLCSYTLFEKKIGTIDCYDEGISVINWQDGGFIISGAYNCSGSTSGWESYLLKTNAEGDTLWTKKNLGVNGISKATRDNHLIFAGANKAGFINDTIKIFKSTEEGNIIWESVVFFPLCKNLATDIIETTDGGFLVTGMYASNSCSNPLYDSFIMKLNANGEIIWEQIISGPGNDQLFSVKEFSNGDIAAFGWTNSKTQNSDADYLLVKLDRDGNTLWEKTYGDAVNNFGYGMDITETDGFIVTGYSNQTEVLKLDGDGVFLWEKKYGTVCGGRYFKVQRSSDGGYTFLGSENQSGSCGSYLMKTNREGDVAWKKIFSGKLRDFTEDQNGAYILTGYIDYLPDIYIVKFDSVKLETIIPTSIDGVDAQEEMLAVKVYPNPANDKVTIEFQTPEQKISTIEVFDINGKKVIVITGIKKEKVELSKGHLPSGIYAFQVKTGEVIYSGKLVFE